MDILAGMIFRPAAHSTAHFHTQEKAVQTQKTFVKSQTKKVLRLLFLSVEKILILQLSLSLSRVRQEGYRCN